MTEIQIECFLSVAHHLNFARASEELNISQPAVTHQIKSLEAELGVKLFKRSTRLVSLTEEGIYFLDDAKSMQQIMVRAKARFKDSDIGGYESLTIGCGSPSQIQLFSEALSQMRVVYPDFHPQFRHVSLSQIPPKVDDELLDIAFGPKMNINTQKKVVYRELFQMTLCCVCPKDHPLAGHSSVTLEDIQAQKLIVYTPVSASPEITITQKKLLGNKKMSDSYLCEFSEDAILLAEAGYGIAILPGIFVPKWASLCAIPIEGVKKMSYGAYYKAHSSDKVLKEFLRQISSISFDDFFIPVK